MMSQMITRLFALFFSSLLLSGCLTESRSDDGPNLALGEISSPGTETFSPGQTFSLDFKLENERVVAEHIGVAFYIILSSKAEQLVSNQAAEAYEVGTYHIAEVVEGSATYTAEGLLIPNEITEAGEYLLVGVVDSAGVVDLESDYDDNRSQDYIGSASGLSGGNFTYLTIDSEIHQDFVLESLTVGEGFALFPEPEAGSELETTAPASIISDMIGFVYATKLGAGETSGLISAEITVAGVSYRAHLWQEDTNLYGDTMAVEFRNFEDSHYFGWDIGINGRVLNALFNAYDDTLDENTMTLEFSLVSDSALAEESLFNNAVSLEVPYMFHQPELPTTTKVSDNANAGKNSGDANLQSSFLTVDGIFINDLYSETYGDPDAASLSLAIEFLGILNTTGAALTSTGALSLSMFGISADLVDAKLTGTLDAGTGEASYDASLIILGDTVIDESDDFTEQSFDWPYPWSEEIELFEADFTIVIVPVTVKAGISGSMGSDPSLTVEGLVISAGGDLFTANLDAYLTAEINLGVASGGITADFLIVEDTFNLTASVDFTDLITNSEFTYSVVGTNDLKAIDGTIEVFVEYPGYDWCCSFPTETATDTIYDSGAIFDKTWTVLNFSDTLSF